MNIVRNMCQYANAAYREPQTFPDFVPLNWRETFVPMARGRDFGFISVEPRRVVISIRGSDTADDNWRVWLSNIRALDRINDTADPGIHDGFGAGAGLFIDAVELYIREAQKYGKDVFLTGHSRGGAIAAVLAYLLEDVYGMERLSVITFGCPAWCNRAIRNDMTLAPIHWTNVRTSYDIVPRLKTLHAAGLRKPGAEYELRTHPIWPFPALPPFGLIRGVIDHFPRTYTRCLA